MTDKELIQALRHCGKFEDMEDYSCVGCPAEGKGCAGAFLLAADRLEALLAEVQKQICKRSELEQEIGRLEIQVEYLKAGKDTNVSTKWVSVEKRLPRYNRDVLCYRPEMAMKVVVCSYDGYYGEDDNEWYEEWSNFGYDADGNCLITHWMPLPEPPSTEGVE